MAKEALINYSLIFLQEKRVVGMQYLYMFKKEDVLCTVKSIKC